MGIIFYQFYLFFRVLLQGVEPPVDRCEEDLDPAGKHYVVKDEEYIK
jgi:hypothetical protein